MNIDDTETIVFDYIDNVVTELTKKRLNVICPHLMKEAQSMEVYNGI